MNGFSLTKIVTIKMVASKVRKENNPPTFSPERDQFNHHHMAVLKAVEERGIDLLK